MEDEAYEEGIHTQPARVREGTGHGKQGSPSSSRTGLLVCGMYAVSCFRGGSPQTIRRQVRAPVSTALGFLMLLNTKALLAFFLALLAVSSLRRR